MTPNETSQSRWSDVDTAQDAAVYLSYLDAAREAVGFYKARSIEMLRLGPTAVALDAGCGTGEDAMWLAKDIGPEGRAWGIDSSVAMVQESVRRAAGTKLPVSFRVSSLDATGFDDATFDAVRSDRVFQHLADPSAALSELLRVLKPGGRIVLSDTDWGSCLVDGPYNDAMKAYLSFAGNPAKNPWSGRRLHPLLRGAGLADIEVVADTVFFVDYPVFASICGVEATLAIAVAAGSLSEPGAQAIRADLQARHEQGRFFACFTIFTACGRKPGSPTKR